MHAFKKNNIFGDLIKKIPYIYFILILGLILRIYRLSHYDLWFDERATVVTSVFFNTQYTLLEKIKFFGLMDMHSLLFPLLLSIWVKFVGISVFKLRLLPAIFSVLTIYGVYVLSILLYPEEKKIAHMGAFLTAISPLHIWYAQEVRSYSMAVFLVTVFAVLVFRLRNKNDGLLFVTTILVGLGVVLSSYIQGIIFVPLILLMASLRSHNKKIIYNLLIRMLLWVFILSLAVLVIFRDNLENFIRLSWLRGLSYMAPVVTFSEFNVGYTGQKIYFLFTAIIFLFVIFIFFTGRRMFGYREKFLLIMSFVPIIVLFIFSLIIFDIYLSRFILAASVFYYILLAAYVVRTGLSGRVFIAILSFIMISSSIQYYNGTCYNYRNAIPSLHRGVPPKTHTLKDAFYYLDGNISAGDIFGFTSWSLGHAFVCYSHHTVINSTYKLYNILGNGDNIEGGVYHFFLKTACKRYEYFEWFGQKYKNRIVDVSKGELWKYQFNNLWLFVSQWYYNSLDENTRDVIKWCDSHLSLVKTVKFPPFEIRQYKPLKGR